MAESQVLTARRDIAEDSNNLRLLDTIFAAILIGGLSHTKEDIDANGYVAKIGMTSKEAVDILKEKKKIYHNAVSHFKATFPDNIFVNEYDIFYQIFVQSENTKYTLEELGRILEDNRSEILSSKYIYSFLETRARIKAANPELSDEEFFRYGVLDNMKGRYLDLSKQVVDMEDYLTACDRYIDVYKERYMFETSEQMSMIVDGGEGADVILNGRKRTLKGTSDAMDYYADRVQVIKRFDEERKVESFVYDVDYLKQTSKRVAGNAILDYGIKDLDSVKTKMRRGNVISIMGPPKGGKTTFTTYLVERALSQGLNVAVWPLEGTTDEWISLITSCAIASGHISKACTPEISKTEILYRDFKGDSADAIREKESVVAGAQYVIAEASKDRGRLSFLTGVAYVEDFEDELTNHYENVNRYDVIVIDSPINMQSRSKSGKSEYLSRGFMSLKNYVANKMKIPALCLITAQYKQSVVDEIRKHPENEIDVTAGAETAESIRTPDDVIGLFSSADERENRKMKVYDIASRSNGRFAPFYMGCALGCAKFWSDDELN